MWASTRCPFCSSTRNIALGSGSTTRPSTSMAPSFFAMPYTHSFPRWYSYLAPAPTGGPGTTSSVIAEQVVLALSQRAFPVTRPQHDERTALAPQGIVPDDTPATNRPP